MKNNGHGNDDVFSSGWKNFFIHFYEQVAEGTACYCLPLDESSSEDRQQQQPLDAVETLRREREREGRLPSEQQKQRRSSKTTASTTPSNALVDDSFDGEEDEIARIGHLFPSHTQRHLTLATTNVSKKRISSTSSNGTVSSKLTFQNPFQLFPPTSNNATRDARSFDSLARSTDTSLLLNEHNNLEELSFFARELPSFGTHHTTNSHGGNGGSSGDCDKSLDMSSYSQAYSPALSSYLYRCQERSSSSLANQQKTTTTSASSEQYPPIPNRQAALQHYRSNFSNSTSTELMSNQHHHRPQKGGVSGGSSNGSRRNQFVSWNTVDGGNTNNTINALHRE